MKNDFVKISIVVLTYNQESLIERSIRSVLTDKDYIHEIIVMDDCSEDNTFEKAQSLAKIYSEIIKPIRNSVNLGIFRNLEASWQHVTGDILYYLAGDDEYCSGFFERTVNFIKENRIDYKSEKFILISDFKTVYPDGSIFVTKQSIVKRYNSVDLKIRGQIFNRSFGHSTSIIKELEPVNLQIGVCAEGIIDIQPHILCEKCYYLPIIGSIYYAGIGVSTKLQKRSHYESYIKYFNELILLNNKRFFLNESSLLYIKYSRAKYFFLIERNTINLLKYICLLVFSTRLKYGKDLVLREFRLLVKNILAI